ncbi:MAG: FtsX-like permease family protein, partial [Gemmatimonadetes bacterium]|nr:FtsX-like permease family protein [Gemmatimonadota bacterium]
RVERVLGQAVTAFAGLVCLLACLGMFGLAAFTAERRRREIGIRKVLGASVSSVVLLLSKAFLKLVLVANLIAWPVAYYLTNTYLQNFAYRASFSLWPFVFSGLLALLIALLTVGTQAFRVANTNPVEILRHE